MTCHDTRSLLLDYEHGELDAATDARVYEHVSACADCRALRQEELVLRDALRNALPDRGGLPTAVVAAIRQQMHRDPEPSFWSRLQLALRPVVTAPVAAALIVVAAVTFAKFDQGKLGAPALSSSYFVREHIAQTMGAPNEDRAWSNYLLTSANTQAGGASPNADVGQ